MRCWPIAVQNAMRRTADGAGGIGIGEENGPTFTIPSVVMVEGGVWMNKNMLSAE